MLRPWWDDVAAGITERALGEAARVPDDVQPGHHLCCGDVEEAHLIQPTDSGHLAGFSRRLLDAAPRRVDRIHLPVPIERDDAAYFAPLRDVAVPEGTRLFLGVVHPVDGVEGALRRIDAASTAVPRSGIGTERGFGRATKDQMVPPRIRSSWAARRSRGARHRRVVEFLRIREKAPL